MDIRDERRFDAPDMSSVLDRRIDQVLALIAEHSFDPVISERAQQLRLTPDRDEEWSEKALRAFHDTAVFFSTRSAELADASDQVGQ